MDFSNLSNEEIIEKITELENEKSALETTISSYENELLYRNFPECRPINQ